MTDPHTATIIPYPTRQLSGTAADRLRRALHALDAALAGQSKAVGAWRAAIADLGTGTRRLSDSLGRYRGELDGVEAKVAALQGEAAALSRTASAISA